MRLKRTEIHTEQQQGVSWKVDGHGYNAHVLFRRRGKILIADFKYYATISRANIKRIRNTVDNFQTSRRGKTE